MQRIYNQLWKMEGKKEKVSIEQIREVVRCLAELNAKDVLANKDIETPDMTALEIISGYSNEMVDKLERKDGRREK